MKNYVYAPIPVFVQETQYVTQMTPIDMGDHFFVGIEVRGLADQALADELREAAQEDGV